MSKRVTRSQSSRCSPAPTGSHGLSSTPQVGVVAAGSRGLSSITSAGFESHGRFSLTSEFDFGNRPFPPVPSRGAALQQGLNSYPTPFPSPNFASDPFSDQIAPPHGSRTFKTESGYTQANPDIASKMEEILDNFRDRLQAPFPYLVTEVINVRTWETFGGANFMTHLSGDDFPFYLRRCYEDIYQVLDERFKGKKQPYGQLCPAVLVTGTPGIGKTVFGMLLSRMVMQRKKPAVLLWKELGYHPDLYTLIWQGKVFDISFDTAKALILKMVDEGLYTFDSHDHDRIELWNISDTCTPIQDCAANQVCISSAGQINNAEFVINLKEWKKKNWVLTLVVPPCTWDEIQQIRAGYCKYTSATEDMYPLNDVRRLYDLWGGVPHTILHNPTSLDVRNEFQRIRIADAMKYIATYKVDREVHSDQLFHLIPKWEDKDSLSLQEHYDARRAKFNWATPALERKAWAHFNYQEEDDVVKYILNRSNDPTSRGRALEAHIHQLIQTRGIQGRLRNLKTGDETDISIPPQRTMFFIELEEIDSSTDYWWRTSSTHERYNSYIPHPGTMLQMTAGAQRPIKIAGLEAILESGMFNEWQNANVGGSHRFKFVVDKSVCNLYDKEQTFSCNEHKQKDGKRGPSKAVESKHKQRRKEAVQEEMEYVLLIDLRPQQEQLGVKRKQGSEDNGPRKKKNKINSS